jgi:hypothetical protein
MSEPSALAHSEVLLVRTSKTFLHRHSPFFFGLHQRVCRCSTSVSSVPISKTRGSTNEPREASR